MGSHRESPAAPLLGSGAVVPLYPPRARRLGAGERPGPRATIDREEFKRRLGIALRRVEHRGLRGQNALAVALAVLVLEDHPDLLQEVSDFDARCGVRNARRAEARRREAEQEAARRRREADPTPGPPTHQERREARQVLSALLKEGAERIPRRELRAFARHLLAMWRTDPDSILDDRHRGGDAVRAIFRDLARRRGVEVTALTRGLQFERILLWALRIWENSAPSRRARRQGRS